jgi:hypothetical protein
MIPFGMSNANNDGSQRKDGKEGKTYLVSPSMKENFPTNLFNTSPNAVATPNNTFPMQPGVSQTVNYGPGQGNTQRIPGIRFAEPYSPERNEFQAVPISMAIEFVNVATGPPWSIGDTAENIRRRELERINQPPPVTADPNAAAANLLQLTNSTALGSAVLSIMEPSVEVLEYARRFTHLTLAAQAVPLTYIRTQLPQIYAASFLNLESATHILHLTSVTGQITTIPIHDLVLVSQCLEIRNRAVLEPSYDGSGKPILYATGVPNLESFMVLLRWFYENDEDGLYESLASSRRQGDDSIVFGFAQNCKFWGVIDPRVFGVVKAVFDADTQGGGQAGAYVGVGMSLDLEDEVGIDD